MYIQTSEDIWIFEREEYGRISLSSESLFYLREECRLTDLPSAHEEDELLIMDLRPYGKEVLSLKHRDMYILFFCMSKLSR